MEFNILMYFVVILAIIILVPIIAHVIAYYHLKKPIPGLIRVMLAASVIFILGASIFYMLSCVNYSEEYSKTITNTLLTAISGAVTTIIGYHFGSTTTRQSIMEALKPKPPDITKPPEKDETRG